MKYAILPIALAVAGATATSAFADEPKLRGEIFCFPAKDVPKLVSELSEVKADRRNIVDVRLQPKFVIKDEGVWPNRFYLAKDGETVQDLPFSRETGAVPTFITAASARPDTDICVDDPTRADRPADNEGLYFEMGLSPLFKTTTGTHSFEELKKGCKDGKKFYKKMLPSAAALFMPDTDYLAIRMTDRKAVPTAYALTGDTRVPLEPEKVKDMWVASLDDIEDLDADTFIVEGGAYDLQPVPSPRTLRRFGMGETASEKSSEG